MANDIITTTYHWHCGLKGAHTKEECAWARAIRIKRQHQFQLQMFAHVMSNKNQPCKKGVLNCRYCGAFADHVRDMEER